MKAKTHSVESGHKFGASSARKWFRYVSGSLVYLTALARAKAGENRADYRYNFYSEEDSRIQVETHGVFFDAALTPSISLVGDALIDTISGATPDGSPPLPGKNQVATFVMHDQREAGFLEPTVKFANQAISGQFSYSEEHDYRSIGVALNDSMDFNEKNTTVLLGISHSFDHILPNEGERYTDGSKLDIPITDELRKNDSDAIVGLTQLLGPDTVGSIDFTLGYEDGFLEDPYKRVLFDDFPFFGGQYTTFPERRPGYKFRQLLFLSLQHNFEKLHGAAELTYRLSNDSFGIVANTTSIQWNQRIGKHITLSPLFRFHTQTQADFYASHFAGDPTNPFSTVPIPSYYSADYRLSSMNTFTYGVQLDVKIVKFVSINLSYKRYEMYGTDGVTSASQYPKANIFTGGLTLWF